MGELGQIQLFDVTLITLRVDKLSLVFGYIFLIATLLGVIYALHVGDWVQHTAGLIYAGSAVGAVFAGDLITLFVFWELTAIASVFLIWASRTERAYYSGQRYLIIQIGSGVILLAGILMYYREAGSIAFNAIGIETLAGQIILIAFGIKCAFPLLHNWLQDSYPGSNGHRHRHAIGIHHEARRLCAGARLRRHRYTRPIGATMTAFPIFYAVIENDLRRVLAYSLNNQLGFMVVGIGIGTETVPQWHSVAHAFCHIIYKALLFMSMGAVLHAGRHRERLGTGWAVPLDAVDRPAFVLSVPHRSRRSPCSRALSRKALIIAAAIALKGEYFWTWLVLLFASAGVFHHSGHQNPVLRLLSRTTAASDARRHRFNMLIAMGIAAAPVHRLSASITRTHSMRSYPTRSNYVPIR